jgi:hypothetical protein
MSNPSIISSHLVIVPRNAEPCAVKKVEREEQSSVLVLRINEAAKTLSRAEPDSRDVTLLIDLTSKEYWRSRCLREIDFTTLLMDVMPKLGIPNCILLDPKFVAFPHSEKKTRLKELCEAVGTVKQVMMTFKTVNVMVKRRDPFARDNSSLFRKSRMFDQQKLNDKVMVPRTDEGLSVIALMHKHKLPPGFRLNIFKGTDGIKVDLRLEKQRVIKLFADTTTNTSSTDWPEKMIEQLRALGPALGIGQTEFYLSTPSSMNWPHGEESVFSDPKTINNEPYKSVFSDSEDF